MARQHIPAHIRRLVIQRANHRCEYCLLPAIWATVPHHVDHIIPLKHGGSSLDDNFASACFDCNLHKGSDIAAFDPFDEQMVRLFNPRIDLWNQHFRIENGQIIGLNPIGRATCQLLQFNLNARVKQRLLLTQAYEP